MLVPNVPLYVQAAVYILVSAVLILRLLPRLIEALTWDKDFPEYGRWFSREYYE